MEVTRVREILRSAEIVQVTLDGKPVWIDGLDEKKQTAKVHYENQPEQEQYVSVEQMEEK